MLSHNWLYNNYNNSQSTLILVGWDENIHKFRKVFRIWFQIFRWMRLVSIKTYSNRLILWFNTEFEIVCCLKSSLIDEHLVKWNMFQYKTLDLLGFDVSPIYKSKNDFKVVDIRGNMFVRHIVPCRIIVVFPYIGTL